MSSNAEAAKQIRRLADAAEKEAKILRSIARTVEGKKKPGRRARS